ncbi:MAG: ribbon-helix-helix protein, CopG family, partial [Alcaligenaceae bacterium]|nr:ribbon-helix-helix protein, CopG family [Alcaligenaceae bacterium]
KKYKARQTQANRQGKKQTNLSLSDAARTQLDQLAKRERLSKTEVIELLIQGAHERGLLN